MKSSIEHKISNLLTREENEQVFRLFGMKCQSLATAVVQLFLTQSPDHTHWVKKDTGVMCFIKDNVRRNYFFRLYCLNRSKMIWEQELYNNFEYKTPQDYFHMFEIDDCVAGINFASDDDALSMKAVVNEKLAYKRQRREERKNRNSLQNRGSIQPNQGLSKPPAFNSNLALSNDKYNQTNSIPYSNVTQSSKNKKKRHLTKEDIGLPENFIHLSHVGWDPNKGFDINVEDPQLKQFFSKAGVSDRQLRDKDTRDFIYDFINTHGGLDAVKSEVITDSRTKKSPFPPPPPSSNQILPTPPPVPARTPINVSTRSAPPPPPPPNKVAKPPPPIIRGQPPPRPEPIQNIPVPEPPRMNNASIPPPPPPPMNDIAAPPPPTLALPNYPSAVNSPSIAAPDPRAALLESIRAGKNLKPVENVERKPSVGDTRGDLLSEIRQGIELKPVQNNQRPSSGPSQENSLAEALSNALKARAFAIQSDSDSDSGNSSENDDWEQDD